MRPAPGAPLLDTLPGPLLVFDSYESALLAACQKIVTKPNATAGRQQSQGFEARWRAGTEYCAWLYYTPDDKYALSKLTDQSTLTLESADKTCRLPWRVDDKRFPPSSINYIYALHNHLYDDVLSPRDLSFILSIGGQYGFTPETKDGKLLLSIIAFFSNSVEAPRCDGFYQYIPSGGRIFKWTRATEWTCEQTHVVKWDDRFTRSDIIEAKAPCPARIKP